MCVNVKSHFHYFHSTSRELQFFSSLLFFSGNFQARSCRESKVGSYKIVIATTCESLPHQHTVLCPSALHNNWIGPYFLWLLLYSKKIYNLFPLIHSIFSQLIEQNVSLTFFNSYLQKYFHPMGVGIKLGGEEGSERNSQGTQADFFVKSEIRNRKNYFSSSQTFWKLLFSFVSFFDCPELSIYHAPSRENRYNFRGSRAAFEWKMSKSREKFKSNRKNS